eukprot:m.142740 g.142740  ORF g.142740 m.142740 type:complete len:83 (+) comp30267_c0_seq1:586-834(+)
MILTLSVIVTDFKLPQVVNALFGMVFMVTCPSPSGATLHPPKQGATTAQIAITIRTSQQLLQKRSCHIIFPRTDCSFDCLIV